MMNTIVVMLMGFGDPVPLCVVEAPASHYVTRFSNGDLTLTVRIERPDDVPYFCWGYDEKGKPHQAMGFLK